MPQVPFWRRYARMFGPDPKADVRDELRFHIDAKTDDLIAQGWTPAAARREAERRFGDLQAVQTIGEELIMERERRGSYREYWDSCAQDLRYALRTLRRDRSFTTIAILMLGLGIAANTAVFSIVNTVLLRPLPFPHSEQLAWFTAGKELKPGVRAVAGLSGATYTVDAFEEFQRHNRSFQSVTNYNAFFGGSEYTLSGRGEPLSVVGVIAACNFFSTLGVHPALGRDFAAEECRKGGPRAVLLSHAIWQLEFSGDPAIVGKQVRLSSKAYTVVGVLPANFDFGAVFSPGMKFDVFVPAVMDELRNWGNTLAVVGRLKPGVSIQQAQAEAAILFPQFKAAHQNWYMSYESDITSLKEFVSGKLRRLLFALWSATGIMLLIVCVNLSNLLLARSAARSKELAVRSALGAARGRILRQFLTESLLLAGAGSALGVVLAVVLIRWVAHQGSLALPLLNSIQIDGAALAWTLAIAISAAIVFGIAPGMSATAANVQDGLRENGRGMAGSRAYGRTRSILVVSEVALACILLTGSGLLLRSFLKILDVDLGFKPAQAAVIKIDNPEAGDPNKRGQWLQEVLDRVKTLPGVEAAGVVDMLPLGRNRTWGFGAKGVETQKDQIQAAIVRIVTPGYLATMGIHLAEGRDFSWNDGPKIEPVVIINRSAARQYWRGEDPVGRMAQVNGNATRVVGVIGNVRVQNVEDAAGPEIYLPVTQAEPEGAELVIRSRLDPAALGPEVMSTLRSLNPGQPATELKPLASIVDFSVSPRRFLVLLVSAFAALGLALASLGIYGVISYSVSQQTQEIGIRIALGATSGQVQTRVVGRALVLALSGIGLGVVGSFVMARWIASLLFETAPTDPVTFAGIVALLAFMAVLGGYLPARRAASINPVDALRGA